MKYFLLSIAFFMSFMLRANAQGLEFLPAKNLYNPPVADPRWPKFAMGISKDYKNNLGKKTWSFSFGENIGLLGFGSKERPFELGVQAATFGIMDIHSKPTALMNTDYFIGIGLSHRHGNFQHLWQLSHLSSHLGDELLLSARGKNIKRINLSHETIKWFIRYKSQAAFSPYMQFGYMVHVEPATIKRFSMAAGLDYLSTNRIFANSTRFVAGGFVNSWQENKYKPTINLRFGVQFERTEYYGRYLQLLLEYQTGQSQDGQFYHLKTNHIGLVVTFSA